MKLSTYLFFNGDCREAFAFYAGVFGAEIAGLQTFAEGPPEMQAAPDDAERIMHVSLPVGDDTLMGSDVPTAMASSNPPGDNFAMNISVESRAEADRLHAELGAGGVPVMEMQEMFWGDYFGMCRDRFGVTWMVNCPVEAA